ncbi:MAG: hypothetical protein ACI9O4_001232 [Chitinophagales bacterium]|jgi:hypothetical protein
MSVFQNIFAKREIVANGEELKIWNKVGIIKTTKNGGKFLQMFHQPETDFFVFDEEKEEDLPIVD